LAPRTEPKPMAITDFIRVRWRQALGEDVEPFTAVARTRHDQLALARDALLIFDFRDEPCRIRLARMHHDRKAKRRWFDSADLGKAFALVGRDKNAVMVLQPHALRRRAA